MPSRTAEWKSRVEALVNAVKDVAPHAHPLPIAKGAAGSRHRTLFRRYVRDLRTAQKVAEDWWDDLVRIEARRVRGERQLALRNMLQMRPVGPLADGELLGTIRKYWLECVAMNADVTPDERVPPEFLVLEWLMDGENDDLARFLSRLPFWPLGLTRKGEWV